MRMRRGPVAISIRLFVLAAILCTANTETNAAQVAWQRDIRTAVQESGRVKKPLMIKFTASWCGFCHKMMKQTFSDERIAEHINYCFVPVSVDADQEKPLLDLLGVETLPTTLIVTPQGKVLKRIQGFQPPEKFAGHLAEICNRRPVQGAAYGATAGSAKPQTVQCAFERVCLPSVLDDHALRLGSTDHVVMYRGVTLCFASVDQKRKFLDSPRKYWPALDGICPVTATDNGARVRGNPEMAVVYRGRIWLCANELTRQQFAANPSKYAVE